ncbi:lantibiotic dehydratase [uncultured Pedobacter sp.]|uniref:lantibiotic dehydratase n=1 Tax=uncultured Pedobacter sp. TaxID=246139 RepID=UPI0025D7962A|nr:lantibiotic dehydratase [uncultured Pedobacter sp.]
MSLQIFPYSLVRYAGLHHQLFDQLQLKDAEHLLSSYQTHFDDKEKFKNRLCDALYPVINLQTDDKVRQQLINFKRQLFNNKQIDPHSVSLLPQTLQHDFQLYLNKLQQLSLFKNECSLKFEEEQHIHQQKIQATAQLPELQNGLLLSSPLLYEQLSNFTQKDVKSFKQKEHRTLFSLMRYLSRMTFKTSPFSSFTYTGLATLSASEISETTHHRVCSRLKLNNAIFEYLKSILKRHPLLNEQLLIKLNITASIKKDKICFLSNINNIESFQQINAKGLQLLVYRQLNQRQSTSFKQLILRLYQDVDNADYESIKIYVIKLVEAGMLEMSLGFSGMDEAWDSKLLLFMESFKGVEPSAIPVITLFQNLQQYRNQYSSAGSFERYQILQEAEKQLNEVFCQLQQEAGLPFYSSASEKKITPESPEAEKISIHKFIPYYFSARHIFYEDCFITEKLELPEQQIKDFVDKTNELISFLLPLDVMRKERKKMRDFFLAHYGDNETADLITFYRNYYFHVKKPEKQEQSLSTTDFRALKYWKDAVLKKLSAIEDNDESRIHLDVNFFDGLPAASDLAKNAATGMFVQFGENENGFAGVINALLPGMGKVSGRFLSLFDQKITKSIVKHNENLHHGAIKVELNDASTFNANIHPPLLAHELELPGGNNIYPLGKQFNISDLRINYDKENEVLRLYKEDTEFYSYDLSLESFYNRSNLYQLLAHFNPDARVSLQPFIQLVDQFYLDRHRVPSPDLFTLPRIVYAQNIILRRKTWRIKTSIIPQQDQFETDFEYFIRLNNWLINSKIPREIFIFLRKRAYQTQSDDKREGLHDDYKPQYLSFHSPLFLAMFKKLLLRAGNYITLEEVFPKPTKNKVSEYLIQWYNN